MVPLKINSGQLMATHATVPDASSGIAFDIKKYALHDGPGIRTTVFFKGCPLGCLWCHNPESQSRSSEHIFRSNRCETSGHCVATCPNGAITLVGEHPVHDPGKCEFCGACVIACPTAAWEIVGRIMAVDHVLKEIVRDTIFYDQSGGGVTFSGGEPLDQPQFLEAMLTGCRELDIHATVDTSCYAPQETMAKLAPLVDLFLCDIKHMDSVQHMETTGVPNELILDNIRWLAANNHALIIRYPLIPECNDSNENVKALGEFVAGLPGEQRVDILPYHPGNQSKGERLIHRQSIFMAKPPTKSQISTVQSILGEYGLETKIGG